VFGFFMRLWSGETVVVTAQAIGGQNPGKMDGRAKQHSRSLRLCHNNCQQTCPSEKLGRYGRRYVRIDARNYVKYNRRISKEV
jgi:hypothetical protein